MSSYRIQRVSTNALTDEDIAMSLVTKIVEAPRFEMATLLASSVVFRNESDDRANKLVKYMAEFPLRGEWTVDGIQYTITWLND